MSTYEPIMDALLSLLETQCGDTFAYYSRKFMTWEEIIQNTRRGQPTTILQPALFLFDGIGFGGGRIKYEQRQRGTPVVRIMSRTIVIYAQGPNAYSPDGPDTDTPGGSIFSPLVESVESALAPEIGDLPGGALTLGGLVSHCWIDGESHWITPDIDPGGQGMVTLPINIMIP